ncbi:hypothetical protein [Faecalimonas sp.]
MWRYDFVTRKEFEKVKDKVEDFIIMLGGKVFSIELPYIQREISYSGDNVIEHISTRRVFEFEGEFYRVSEICLNKPFVILEVGTYEELIKNHMEDENPFPYDLPDSELLNEVKYALGIEMYPKA